MNKKLIYYILGTIVLTTALFFVGRWTAPVKVKTEYVCEQGYEIRDTCIDKKTIATISVTDTFQVKNIIKKGKKTTVSEKPDMIQSASIKDKRTTSFYKKYNYGLVRLEIDFGISHVDDIKLENFDLSYEVDTMIAKEIYSTTQTIVIRDSTDESGTVQYIPVLDNKPQTWIGLESGFIYNDDIVVPVGLTLDRGRNSFGIYKDVTEPFNSWKGVGLKYKRDLIKVSSK